MVLNYVYFILIHLFINTDFILTIKKIILLKQKI